MIFSYPVHLVHFVQLAVLRLPRVLGPITLFLLRTHLPWRIPWTRLKYMNVKMYKYFLDQNESCSQ